MSEKTKKFSSEEIASFCDQIAMLQKGGIPLYEGAAELAEEMEDGDTKAVLNIIKDKLRDNMPLFQALDESKAFPSYMVYMTKVGEDTGKLEDVMRGMGTYYDREASMKAEIKSAVTFPIVLFAMMSVIMLVLVFKINPMFKNMFSELASDTAQVSSRMMNIGTVVGRVCSIIIIAVLILIVALFAVTKTKKGGSLVDTFLIKFKPTRRLSSMMVKSKFMSAMTLMVQSGMPLDQALEATMDGASGSAKDEIKEAARLMKEENLSLDEALLKTNIITGMDNKMIAIALKAGVSDEAFAKLSDRYNEEVGEALMGISTKVETTLVIILALMVGIVLVSVMLPLVSLIGSIQ